MHTRFIAAGVAVALGAPCAVGLAQSGEETVVTFDDGRNTGGWSYFGQPGNAQEIFEDVGGPHAVVLRSPCGPPAPTCLSTHAPIPRTALGAQSVFTGDYRERAVTSVGVDAAIFAVEYGRTGDRPMTLVLRSDNGTPRDGADDVAVYLEGDRNIPQPNGAWGRFDFAIPADSQTLPEGWRVMPGWDAGLAPDEVWSRVITDVDQVWFHHGSPELFYAIQGWDLAIDNPRITVGADATCQGDVDGDGLVGGADLSRLLGAWGPSGNASRALDFNGDGVIDGADLAVILSRWGACS